MKLLRTNPFKEDFQKLPDEIKRRVEKALRLLATDLRHPSLRARIVDKRRRIWKANINGGYRFTFQILKDGYLLRAVGSHKEMLRPERW
jgi:mRNA-degrading endonuclease RelE of RelBE toxin-antitoxin system